MSFVDVVFPTPLKQSFSYRLPETLLAGLGFRVAASFGKRSMQGYVIGSSDTLGSDPGFEIKSIEKVLDQEPIFDEAMLELARWVSEMYFCSIGEALSAMLPGAKQEREFELLPETDERLAAAEIVLSEEQKNESERVLARPGGMSFLHGLTGSGKTQVYLHCAERTLAEGRGVIFLVPEISLTHQMVGLIERRFPGKVALLHSGLTPSQRLAQWRRIQRGEARVVIGARSAVFAPVKRLGLIVVDEEHESSYKSGSTPRYHARQVAMRRSIDEEARLLMGSATPSVEAWHLMAEKRLERLELTKRLAGGSPPSIRIVSMKGSETSLSPELLQAVRDTKSAGRQTILFLNRRGFAYFFYCRSCHYEMTCERCSVSMTYHKQRNLMVCHYCGSVARPISVCPQCNSLDVGYAGFGTEKVEEDVGKFFPDLKIARLDADSVRTKGSLEKTIGAFKNGEIDVLLGTQMVAKGLNFPGVRLVGIVNADTGLHMPDFRAAERGFGLITQVAGRAGRFADDGEVIIQTFKPEAKPIALAAAADIAGFYEWELAQRRDLAFPPFTRLFRLVFRAASSDRASHAAREFLLAYGKKLKAFAEVLGPAECPLARVNNSSRYHILISTKQFAPSHRALGAILETYRTPSGVYLEVDTDPVSLL